MKRRLFGEINVIGYYPVGGMEALYVLSPQYYEYWEKKKNTYAIALCWRGNLHFRQIYLRKDEYCFKFFNRIFYLSEVIRTEGTCDYIVL